MFSHSSVKVGILCPFLFLLFLLLLSSTAGNPGFVTRITQRAFDLANRKAKQNMETFLRNFPFPDIDHHTSFSLRYTLINMRRTSFTMPSIDLRTAPGRGWSWKMSKGAIVLSAESRIDDPKFTKRGIQVAISISGITSDITITLAISGNRPMVYMYQCIVKEEHIDITTGHDVLPPSIDTLFKTEVQKEITKIIQTNVCAQMTRGVQIVNTFLGKFQADISLVHDRFRLDYAWIGATVSQWVDTYHKGMVTWARGSQPPPFQPGAIQLSSSGKMMYLGISEYMFKSFAYAAQKNGFLTYKVTSKDLPSADASLLNTTCTSRKCIGTFLPAVAQAYPGSTVELRVTSTEQPNVTINYSIGANFSGNIDVYAHTPNGQIPYLFTLHMTIFFTFQVSVGTQAFLSCKISGRSFNVFVVKSVVGPLDEKTINVMAQIALDQFVIPVFNGITQGQGAFPLPVKGVVSFTSSEMQIRNGAIVIGTDVSF